MMKNLHYILLISSIITTAFVAINSCHKEDKNDPPPTLITGTVTDMEGNIYKTVVIGSQVWMAENMRATRYRNGDSIPNVTDGEQWINLTSGAYCDYDTNPSLGLVYGKLYNWYAVQDERNLAPQGWHVASDADWIVFGKYIGCGDFFCGLKIKETGYGHWISSAISRPATNETGFTALPGGIRLDNSGVPHKGAFNGIGLFAYWWTFTEATSENAWARHLDFAGGFLHEGDSSSCENNHYCYDKNFGLSVRCVQD